MKKLSWSTDGKESKVTIIEEHEEGEYCIHCNTRNGHFLGCPILEEEKKRYKI